MQRFCVGAVPSVKRVRSILDSVSASYTLFLAVDASSIDDESLREMGRSLLERGISYLCVWGPDCERVHDQFDMERMPSEPKGRVVMTTWHSKESLSKALWFFANCVEPDYGFEPDCKDWVAVSVNDEAWAREIGVQLTEAGSAPITFLPNE